MTGRAMDRHGRYDIGRLASLAAMRKDNDLAALAALTGRIRAAEAERTTLDQALAGEIAATVAAGEIPALMRLEVHVIQAEAARGRLDAALERLDDDRRAAEARCRISFGQWTALDALVTRQKAMRRGGP